MGKEPDLDGSGRRRRERFGGVPIKAERSQFAAEPRQAPDTEMMLDASDEQVRTVGAEAESADSVSARRMQVSQCSTTFEGDEADREAIDRDGKDFTIP